MVGFLTNCYAADGDVYNDGWWRVTSTGAIVPVSGASQQFISEKLATGDTLLSTESGKTVVVTATTGTIKYTLPSAATAGLEFTFVDGKSTGSNTFSVDPYSTNQILYLTLDAGDKITSPGATGDNVTLISDASGNWFVKNMFGTFTDGGA